MGLILAERIEQAVNRAFAELNGTLEQLVDQELDQRIGQLVAERLDARNGHVLQQPEQTAKACKTCGTEKPADQFERGRHSCRECRRADLRSRQPVGAAGASADAPHPTRPPASPRICWPPVFRRVAASGRSERTSSPTGSLRLGFATSDGDKLTPTAHAADIAETLA